MKAGKHYIQPYRDKYSAERTIKRFYARFQVEYAAFFSCVQGIDDPADRARYTSLFLHHRIFLHFLQQNGYLDAKHMGGPNSEPRFLNPTLFAISSLEQQYPAIYIPDAASTRLYAFFNEFDWQPGSPTQHSEREITPDVLKYIFEKRAKQNHAGAHYTREDVATYICQYTIIPALLDKVAQRQQLAFHPTGSLWSLLRENPDRYIHAAIKKGCSLPLPPAIEAGAQNMAQRTAWNRPASEIYALPTETWREVITRRAHYFELTAKLSRGDIITINDLITHNLDMCQFAQDILTRGASADLLYAFYESLSQLTILDPTCGSGAFLFAALSILEPLYTTCLERVHILLDTCDIQHIRNDQVHSANNSSLVPLRAIIKSVDQYPNRQFFIYTSIFANNLYGVDIMEEATEICTLRLLLKLFSTLTSPARLDLLASIRLNMHTGNTLVGFTSRIAREEACQPKSQYRTETFAHITAELDHALAAEYGIDQHTIPNTSLYMKQFEQWQRSHKPFHWSIEFAQIMHRGGFDIVLGNPPYVEYTRVKQHYQVLHYQTFNCGNLYAYTMERGLQLAHHSARFGMIVPISAISGERYQLLNELLSPHTRWISTYANRPGKLFADIEQRLAIFLAEKHTTPSRERHAPALHQSALPGLVFSEKMRGGSVSCSSYRHWYEAERKHLFSTLAYYPASTWHYTHMPVKSGHILAEQIFTSLGKQPALHHLLPQTGNFGVWVHDGPTYWVRALPFEPNTDRRGQRSRHYHRLTTRTQEEATMLSALLSSSTFYLFYKLVSNCRDLGQKEWLHFPFARPQPDIQQQLIRLGISLARRLRITTDRRIRHYSSGTVIYETYYPAHAKDILDSIDRVLASHYGFSSAQLDFILNYDIKYRMGRTDDSETEEEETISSVLRRSGENDEHTKTTVDRRHRDQTTQEKITLE